jgi:transcription antitermination factor NusG
MMALSWFIARTNPRQETVASVFLKMLPEVDETFLPYVRKKVLYKGRVSYRRELMFQSYIFVGCGMNERTWGKINYTPGVSRLLMGAGEFFPKEVDCEILEAIKRCMNDGAVRLHTDRDFGERQAVRITAGKYTGIEGLFGHDARGRVGAFIKLFNREQWVPVAEEALTAA